MHVRLSLDDDVAAVARELAQVRGETLGSVISELARRGLTMARDEPATRLPVIRVPAGTAPITPEMVRHAQGDD